MDFGPLTAKVSEVENADLTLPFSMEEVGRAIADMRACSALGPDGLPISFQKFGPQLQAMITDHAYIP